MTVTEQSARGGEFIWPLTVYYEDTDAGGVVYHARYLHFMERARSEWLRHLGYRQDELRTRLGVLFAVRRASLEFKTPARLEDPLQVRSRVHLQRRTCMQFEQLIYKQESLLCAGTVEVVAIGADDFRPCAIPEPIRRELEHVC